MCARAPLTCATRGTYRLTRVLARARARATTQADFVPSRLIQRRLLAALPAVREAAAAARGGGGGGGGGVGGVASPVAPPPPPPPPPALHDPHIPEFAPGDIAVDAATLLGPPGSYGAVHPATLTATGAPVAVKVSSFDLCWTVWCLSWAPPGLHL